MKLNQVVAVVNGQKTKSHQTLTQIHQRTQKGDLFSGLSRSYTPTEEGEEQLPPEEKRVQFTIKNLVNDAKKVIAEVLDTVLTQDTANCEAKADLVVDGTTIAVGVPVTYMLFLEKQLQDLHKFVATLPVLSATSEWELVDSVKGIYKSPIRMKNRTKKKIRNHVKAEATDKFPAQVELYHEDVVVGVFNEVEFSGAMKEEDKARALERIEKLQEAVKLAREEANQLDVTKQKISGNLFAYVFQGA